ncbi:hypothetical protein J2W14_002052 [Pseudarthrobacter oxydans]|nr:hypothetical protein [Pseudarthrobacter oxydans]
MPAPGSFNRFEQTTTARQIGTENRGSRACHDAQPLGSPPDTHQPNTPPGGSYGREAQAPCAPRARAATSPLCCVQCRPGLLLGQRGTIYRVSENYRRTPPCPGLQRPAHPVDRPCRKRRRESSGWVCNTEARSCHVPGLLCGEGKHVLSCRETHRADPGHATHGSGIVVDPRGGVRELPAPKERRTAIMAQSPEQRADERPVPSPGP